MLYSNKETQFKTFSLDFKSIWKKILQNNDSWKYIYPFLDKKNPCPFFLILLAIFMSYDFFLLYSMVRFYNIIFQEVVFVAYFVLQRKNPFLFVSSSRLQDPWGPGLHFVCGCTFHAQHSYWYNFIAEEK